MLFHQTIFSQHLFDQPIHIQRDTPLLELISTLEDTSAAKFFYLDEWIDHLIVSKDANGIPLKTVLQDLVKGSQINVVFLFNYAVIFFRDPHRQLTRDSIIRSVRKRKIEIENITIGSPKGVRPGARLSLRGTVMDSHDKKPIVGTTIYVNDLGITTQSLEGGIYQLVLPAGEYVVTFRFLNYEEKAVNLALYENGTVNVDLEEMPVMLQEITISDQSMVDRRVGQAPIKMAEVSRAPAFLGEVDIVRSLQSQTGVTSVSEASSGFNVRGGGVDQNLVLFDGVPIFNTSHALGFFSAFIPDAIKDASFYKGSIPAEYGGRVSSVLSMNSKEGDSRKWGGNLGVSFVSSDLTLGGPLKKDTSSLNVSIRSTYSDWLLKLLNKTYNNVHESSISFFDGAMKFADKLKNGAKLTLSAYASRDQFSLANDTVNQWQNLALAARYDNRLLSEYYYSIGIYLGQYGYKVSEPDPATAFDLRYRIFYPAIKLDVNREGRHKQTFGFHSTFYNFQPGKLTPTTHESNSRNLTMPEERSIESALFFSHSFLFKAKFNIDAGIRFSVYSRLGPGSLYRYHDGAPLEPRNTVDSIAFQSGEVMKTYGGPEPRLSIRYSVNPRASLKFGYNRVYQYVHLVSNTATLTPVDIWQSSNTYFKPQIADQISLGYFTSSQSQVWQSFFELFYKHTQNVLDFKDGASLILNPKLETALLAGISRSFGAEFAIGKTSGRLEMEMNYTFSRSLRQVNGFFNNEKINNGSWYPSNYDQPHIVNFNWRYKLGRKVFFSGIFTYHTGRPVSLPIAAYEVNEVPVIDFSDRNNYRLPDYHRLDIALVIEGSNKKDRKVQGQWTLSVYNLYGRKNPYSAFFIYNVAGAVKPRQISLVGVPVPSISYGIKF